MIETHNSLIWNLFNVEKSNLVTYKSFKITFTKKNVLPTTV
jgi:hypothetical protein